jgi:hypothetical protein
MIRGLETLSDGHGISFVLPYVALRLYQRTPLALS